jgi:hypothetical protein
MVGTALFAKTQDHSVAHYGVKGTLYVHRDQGGHLLVRERHFYIMDQGSHQVRRRPFGKSVSLLWVENAVVDGCPRQAACNQSFQPLAEAREQGDWSPSPRRCEIMSPGFGDHDHFCFLERFWVTAYGKASFEQAADVHPDDMPGNFEEVDRDVI